MSKYFIYLIFGVLLALFVIVIVWNLEDSTIIHDPELDSACRSLDILIHLLRTIDGSHKSPKHENSWRLEVLVSTMPTLRHIPRLNVPWQSQAWQEWDNDLHRYFTLSSEFSNAPRAKRYTRIMGIVGPDSGFEYIRTNSLQSLRLRAPQTILLTEVANSKVPWMKDGDLELEQMPATINPNSRVGIGTDFDREEFIVGFADGSVWLISTAIPYSVLEPFLSVEGSCDIDRNTTLGPYGTEVKVDKSHVRFVPEEEKGTN